MASLPTGTATFLFSDIEGSTQLLKQLGQRYEEVLADHKRLLQKAFEESSGLEIDTQGDAFFVVFNRAKNAVAAALAAQRALAANTWPEGVVVRVRMGMHTAEPSVTADGYVGLGVHRAARICSAGHGGQVLLSQATQAVLADEVLTGIRLRDLGEHLLKDLDRPERLFQLVVPDLPEDFPVLRTVEAVAPPFAGRERELETDAAALTQRERIRVVVADDSLIVREGLCRLLAESGFVIAGRAADAEGLLREVGIQRPAVVVTDIRMPPTHTDEGLVAAERIRRTFPETGVLVLSQYLESRYALRLLESYPERIGYLLKDRVSEMAVLGDAIRRIAEGECVIDPTIVSRLMKRRRVDGPLGVLSEEEQELLALVAEGHTDDAIREKLGLNPDELATRLRRLFDKLDLDAGRGGVRRLVSVLHLLRGS
jgi:class 3 adenylate cyclase/DNA-binding NarL/FixJ family response regulator